MPRTPKSGWEKALKNLEKSMDTPPKTQSSQASASDTQAQGDKAEPAKKRAPGPMPNSLKRLRAGLRGQDSAPEIPSSEQEADKAPENPEENNTATSLYPVSAAKEEERARTTPAHDIGEAVEGKGVYLGLKELKDKKGGLVGLFDLYAAPEDLKKTNWLGQKKQLALTFHEAVSHVAKIKDWHGFDGFNHSWPGMSADEKLYSAMRDGRYKGEWFIPPIDILKALDENQHKGALKDSFVIQRKRKTEAHWYLSCSEDKEEETISTLRMADGITNKDKAPYRQSVRCVRAEPRP